MTCRDLSEFLLEYVSGELPAPMAAEFEVHLKSCDNCIVFIDQYRRAIALGRTVMIEADAAGVPEDLVQAIVASIRTGG